VLGVEGGDQGVSGKGGEIGKQGPEAVHWEAVLARKIVTRP
jgi:hypothetical protein